jgi:uncharacterized protein YjeT (DUF2065 family)
MKLVNNARDWSKWWSVRLSIIGGALLTLLEGFPDAANNIIHSLPEGVQIPDDILRVVGIICVLASPIARVIKQSDVGTKGNRSD